MGKFKKNSPHAPIKKEKKTEENNQTVFPPPPILCTAETIS